MAEDGKSVQYNRLHYYTRLYYVINIIINRYTKI